MNIKVTKQQLLEIKNKLKPLTKKALIGKPAKKITHFMQGLVPMGEEVVNESPDKVLNNYDDLIAHWSNEDAIGFGFLNNTAFIGYNNDLFFESNKISQEIKDSVDYMGRKNVEQLMTHKGISRFYEILYGENGIGAYRSNFEYPGRLWFNKKIISFWQYPDKNKLSQLLKSLYHSIEKIYGIEIDFSNYRIEIKNDEYQADLDSDDEDYEPDLKWETNQKIGKLILIKDFISSNDATEQEMQNIHLLPSDEKRNTPQIKAAMASDAKFLANKFNGNVSQAEWNDAKKKYQGESKTIKIITCQLNEIKKHLNEEFVYHASQKPIDKILPYSEYKSNKSGYYPGMYFFNNKEISKQFYDPSKYNIYKTNIDGLKLYNLIDGDELKKIASENGVDVNGGSGYREAYWLESIGYDGIKRGLHEIILFNPEKLNIEKVVPDINENINIPITTGDTVMMGKFKNKKTVVKNIDKDSHGMPTINGKQAATFRTTNIKKEKIEEEISFIEKEINIKDILPTNSDGQNLKDAIYDVKFGLPSKTEGKILVKQVGDKYEIGDGFHRVAEAILNGNKTIFADIVQGNINEATIEDVNLSSFKPKKELNEKFWLTPEKNNSLIKPLIRKRLLKIADDFIDFLKIDIKKIEDVLFLGSLANYNWSTYSDIDLHLLIDMKKINKDDELVKDYFDAKKKIWSAEHDELKICGFPVEIYVQDINEQNASVGIYSLERNKWLAKPSEINDEDFNKKKIKEKAAWFMTEIDGTLTQYKNKPTFSQLTNISNRSKLIYDKIKRLRKSGLASEDGEISVGNIVFKVLRRNGYLEKLIDLKAATYDKINSIK